jgi:hypothetical protein
MEAISACGNITVISNIGTDDLVKTAILAAIGALVSPFFSSKLKVQSQSVAKLFSLFAQQKNRVDTYEQGSTFIAVDCIVQCC